MNMSILSMNKKLTILPVYYIPMRSYLILMHADHQG